jgi:hypothetical protein
MVENPRIFRKTIFFLTKLFAGLARLIFPVRFRSVFSLFHPPANDSFSTFHEKSTGKNSVGCCRNEVVFCLVFTTENYSIVLLVLQLGFYGMTQFHQMNTISKHLHINSQILVLILIEPPYRCRDGYSAKGGEYVLARESTG